MVTKIDPCEGPGWQEGCSGGYGVISTGSMNGFIIVTSTGSVTGDFDMVSDRKFDGLGDRKKIDPSRSSG